MDLKNRIEALLFSSGRRMSVEEIAKLCHKPQTEVLAALQELKTNYSDKDSSLMVIDEGIFWKITVKEEHLSLVKKIVTETELSKTLMETLAVIAFKYPIKQCDLIKLRTNKAYDHLSELEQMGYITRQKFGRTKLIKLSQRFFDYFSLPEEQLKEKFKDFESIASAIKQKEDSIEKIKEEEKKKAAEDKKLSEVRQKDIELLDREGQKTKLEIINMEPTKEQKQEQEKIVTETEKLGNLEVVDEPEEKEIIDEDVDDEEAEQKPKQKEEGEQVDRIVDEILNPEEVSEESSLESIPEEIPEEAKPEEESSEEEKPEEPEKQEETNIASQEPLQETNEEYFGKKDEQKEPVEDENPDAEIAADEEQDQEEDVFGEPQEITEEASDEEIDKEAAEKKASGDPEPAPELYLRKKGKK